VGRFEHSIRNQQVPHPTRRDVNMLDWTREYRTRGDGQRDDNLFVAGVWVHKRLIVARKYAEEAAYRLKPGTPILRLIVAEINRRMRHITDKHKSHMKRLADLGMIVNPGVIARFRLGDTGESEFSCDNIIALLGDILGKMHREYGATPIAPYFFYGEETIQDIRQLVDATLQIIQLENVWQGCVWLNYEVEEVGDTTHIRYGRDNISRSVASSEDRFNNNSLAVSAACAEGWKHGATLPPPPIRWVQFVKVEEAGLSYHLSDWREEEMPPSPYKQRRSALAGVPDEILEHALPEFGGITSNMLFDAMEALQSLAEVFFVRNAQLCDELSASWMDSPIISIRDCVHLVSEACAIDDEKAKRIVGILTLETETARDGAWGMPLIPADNGHVYFAFPVLLTNNPIRLLDHWLIRGGMDKNAKGEILEKIARSELLAALAQNRTLTDAAVYEEGLRLEGNNKPEIDALIRIGKRVLVCEIKSLIFPVTPIELYKHARIIFEDGVKQAHNELKMALRHRPKIAECTRYTGNPDDLVLSNIVLVRGRIGSGLTIDNVPILDVELLAQYLSGGILKFIYDSRNFFGDAADSIILYDDPRSAEANLEGYIKAPPTEELRHIHTKNDKVETPDVFNGGRIISDNLVVEPFSSFDEMRKAVAVIRSRWIECCGFAR